MYSYAIPDNPHNIIKIGFTKTNVFNNSFLFKITSDISKISYPLANSKIRRDFSDGNYVIKPYNRNSSLVSDIFKNNIVFDLVNLVSSYNLKFVKLNYKLQPVYKLSDKLINFNVIIDYIPFYSNNYKTYVIRNFSNPNQINLLLLINVELLKLFGIQYLKIIS